LKAAAKLGLGLAMGLAACMSEPLEDDRASGIVLACCAEARERVEIARDVESQQFRERCSGCQRGESKRSCARAASKVQEAVKRAYKEEPMPISCEAMRSGLADVGVEIPSLR
jgi:hypothetical protein